MDLTKFEYRIFQDRNCRSNPTQIRPSAQVAGPNQSFEKHVFDGIQTARWNTWQSPDPGLNRDFSSVASQSATVNLIPKQDPCLPQWIHACLNDPCLPQWCRCYWFRSDRWKNLLRILTKMSKSQPCKPMGKGAWMAGKFVPTRFLLVRDLDSQWSFLVLFWNQPQILWHFKKHMHQKHSGSSYLHG